MRLIIPELKYTELSETHWGGPLLSPNHLCKDHGWHLNADQDKDTAKAYMSSKWQHGVGSCSCWNLHKPTCPVGTKYCMEQCIRAQFIDDSAYPKDVLLFTANKSGDNRGKRRWDGRSIEAWLKVGKSMKEDLLKFHCIRGRILSLKLTENSTENDTDLLAILYFIEVEAMPSPFYCIISNLDCYL